MAAALDVAKGRLFVLLWLLVVLDLGLDSLVLRRVAEVALALLMLLALPGASLHIRVLALLLFAGTAAFTWQAGDWAPLERGLAGALAIGAFLPVVGLVRATVSASPTVPAVRERVGAMAASERRTWMTGGAVLFGAILTLGYVSVLRPLLPQRLDAAEATALAEAGIRGLGLTIVWSPFFVASAVAGQLVPSVAAWQIVAWGGALGLLGAVVAHLMFNRGAGVAAILRALRRLGPAVPACLLLVGAVVIASGLTRWSTLQSVVAVVPAICAVYVALRARSRAASVVRETVSASGRISDEVLILTASAVFGAAMPIEAVSAHAAGWVGALAGLPSVTIAVTVTTIATLGVLGIHPMLTASVLVPTLIALQWPIAPLVLALVVTFAWGLSATVAAWTLPLVASSTAFGVPVRRLVFGANLRYVVAYGVAGCLALAVVNRLLV